MHINMVIHEIAVSCNNVSSTNSK